MLWSGRISHSVRVSTLLCVSPLSLLHSNPQWPFSIGSFGANESCIYDESYIYERTRLDHRYCRKMAQRTKV